MAEDDQLRTTLSGFAALLAAVTEMVRAKGSHAGRLDAYDQAADQIIDDLRSKGIGDDELQSIHKALARLRLALEEEKR